MLAAPAATAGAICVDRAAGHADPHAGHRPLRRRDRAGQAGRAAVAGPGPGRLHLAGAGDLLAAGRHRPHRLDAWRSRSSWPSPCSAARMALALSVWARKPHEVVLVVYTFWVARAAPLADLVRSVAWEGSSARRPTGASWRTRTTWRSPPTPCPAGSISGTTSASSPWRWGLPPCWRSWRSGGCGPSRARGTDDNRKGPGLGLIGRLTRWLPGPSLDGNPVLWREWHRSRPSRWLTILIVLLGGSTGDRLRRRRRLGLGERAASTSGRLRRRGRSWGSSA